MIRIRLYQKRRACMVFAVILAGCVAVLARMFYLMVWNSERYAAAAEELHERERPIKAARGILYDRNMVVLADNMSVCTISVVHSQIKDPEKVIRVLSEKLSISEESVRKRVEKNSSMERIKTNVLMEIADEIRAYDLEGVKIDEDYKRFYPYDTLASKVLGFTGSDNQGIIGLEVKYEAFLKGIPGTILTTTTASGVELADEAEERIEPVNGNHLVLSMDVVVQSYATQIANKVLEAKNAKSVSIVVMNPNNGELYAMVNVPEFSLNSPYDLSGLYEETVIAQMSAEAKSDARNEMWRNQIISNTYEPGSAFKIVTAVSAFEHGVLHTEDRFYCPGYRIVEDRRIRCHKVAGHGSESFTEGIKNSCNPVFMDVAARVGIDGLYETFRTLGLFEKTGVDLPGEANSIMHAAERVGAVELATIAFGQSFQITPLQLMKAVSIVVNGGREITPHFAVKAIGHEGNVIKTFRYEGDDALVSSETTEKMRSLLEIVVSEGTGNRAYLPGMRIAGKTATSEKLPRSLNEYIASFIGFAPADHPQIMAMVLIDEPEGIYYGGTIAAPVVAELFDMILPYLSIEPEN